MKAPQNRLKLKPKLRLKFRLKIRPKIRKGRLFDFAIHRLHKDFEKKGLIKPRLWHRLLPHLPAAPRLRGYLHEETKILFIDIRKAASTSIKRSFLESEEVRRNLDDAKEDFMRGLGFTKTKHYFNGGDIGNSVFRGGQPDFGLRKNLMKIKGIRSYKRHWFRPKFLSLNGCNQQGNYQRRRIGLEDIEDYFIFTFVRNPFARLVSCFQNKYIPKNSSPTLKPKWRFLHPTFPLLQEISGFEDLVAKLHALPSHYVEEHLALQSIPITFFLSQGGRIDFIGKVENLPKAFEPIRQKYHLLPLEWKNPSRKDKKLYPDWRDYYDYDSALKTYQIYKADFDFFGYQDEYDKLLCYIKK